jgi:hypothetical protein
VKEGIHMKKFVLSLMLITVLMLSACQNVAPQQQPVYAPTLQSGRIITVDINPSITFILDDEDKVVGVIVNNAEGEIISADLDFMGLSWDAALEQFLSAAQATGYLDVRRENNLVTISVSSQGKEDIELFRNTIENRVQRFLDREDIKAGIEAKEMALDDLQATADEYEVTVAEWMMIQALLKGDATLTLEDALVLTPEEIQIRLQSLYQERRSQALEFKEELTTLIRAEVEAYFNAIEAGEIVPPTSAAELRDLLRQRFRSYMEARQNEVSE